MIRRIPKLFHLCDSQKPRLKLKKEIQMGIMVVKVPKVQLTIRGDGKNTSQIVS